ncbi:zincin [Neocallimastix californiae]|uniref:Zincin n=1 Tax=Neocallimastix californiae TaxID=1754190 RepID=A0A1Y2ADA3_9FUNG|nr:zincin [Neocallimastix californiae]|eukprot:ORY20486.1 zincin [Neocallimastix californiae]
MKFKVVSIIIATLSLSKFVISSPFKRIYDTEEEIETEVEQNIVASEISSSEEETQEISNDNLCKSKECYETSNRILSGLDTSVDPCEDFYQFTCNNWMNENIIPEGEDKILNFLSGQEETTKVVQDIVTGNYIINKNQSNEDQQYDEILLNKLNSLYKSCINTDKINEQGKEPILNLINELKINENRLYYNDTDILTSTLAEMHDYGMTTLIDVDVINPSTNARHYYITVLEYSGALESYEESEKLNQYRKMIETSFSVIFGDQPERDINKMTENVIEFEKSINSLASPELYVNAKLENNKMKFGEMIQRWKYINWELYFKKRFGDKYSEIKEGDDVLLFPAMYFDNLEKVLAETDVETLAIYFEWKVIKRYIKYISEDIVHVVAPLYDDIDENLSRNSYCYSATVNAMPMTVSRFYAEKVHSNYKKEYAEKTFEYVKQAMMERIGQMEWLEDETKKYAIKKLSLVKDKIGYPEFLKHPKNLVDKYNSLEIGDDFFTNILNYHKYTIKEVLNKYNTPYEVTDMALTNQQTINAFYSPNSNSIFIPTASLQPPFINTNSPNYLNFGSLGTVIGHELTHAFDGNGKNYDIEGKINNWWVNNDVEEFVQLAQCFIEQYNQYYMEDDNHNKYYVSGLKSINENLADNGGLTRAYEAWKLSLKEDPKQVKKDNPRLPGLSQYSFDQLFFISFGQTWCAKFKSDPSILAMYTNNGYSPGQARVNGSVSNSPYFAKVFNCANKTPMNPDKKCVIW